MEALFDVGVFVLFGALWLAFAAALIWSQGSLDQTWTWLRSLPVILQAVVWLLLLPVTAGLWAWETSWPIAIRLLAVGGLAFVNIALFFPRAVFAPQP